MHLCEALFMGMSKNNGCCPRTEKRWLLTAISFSFFRESFQSSPDFSLFWTFLRCFSCFGSKSFLFQTYFGLFFAVFPVLGPKTSCFKLVLDFSSLFFLFWIQKLPNSSLFWTFLRCFSCFRSKSFLFRSPLSITPITKMRFPHPRAFFSTPGSTFLPRRMHIVQQ